MPREKSEGKFVSGWNAQVKLWGRGAGGWGTSKANS